MPLTEAEQAALAAWLAPVLAARRVDIDAVSRLGGGAIQDNVALDVTVHGGPRDGRQPLVLRMDAKSGVAESWGRVQEHRVLEVVHGAGLKVAEPIALDEAGQALGRPFSLMQRLDGEARGRRLVRDPLVQAEGERIAQTLGHELAKLHRIPLPQPLLAFLPEPGGDILAARIADVRRSLDALGEAQPTLEYGLRWLERSPPEPFGRALVHADLRTGNFLVHRGEVTGILDWEFARISDPLEDLGWLLARCWRYGENARPCGGIGSRAALLDSYAFDHAPDQPRGARLGPDPLDVARWELFATVRWAVIALQQAARHDSGAEPSLELGLTRWVVPSLERDVLDYTDAIGRGDLL